MNSKENNKQGTKLRNKSFERETNKGFMQFSVNFVRDNQRKLKAARKQAFKIQDRVKSSTIGRVDTL